MTDEEIHNIYLHMSGKAEGLVEATGKADFPVLFARAILEYDKLTKDAQNMASKSTYKEQVETKNEPVGWIDSKGYMICVKTDESCRPLYTHPPQPKQEQSEPVAWEQFHEHMAGPNYVAPQRIWIGMTEEEIQEILGKFYAYNPRLISFAQEIEAKLKEKNNAV